jgi:serine protease
MRGRILMKLVQFGRSLGVAALAGLLALPALAEPTQRPANGLIVKLRNAPPHGPAEAFAARGQDDTERSRLQRVLGAAGVAGARSRPVGRAAQHVDFGHVLKGSEAERLASQLRQHPEVEWVVPNERERRLAVAPSDPYFASQWWLQNPGGSNANALSARLRGVPGFQGAWVSEAGRPSAAVAVLDTGITQHPDLVGHVLPGYDFVSTLEYANDGNGRDNDASDPGDWVSQADIDQPGSAFDSCQTEESSWHGTQIAGIVAAVTGNATGIASTSWNGRVLPVRVAGKCGADVADIVDGLRWAAGLPVPGAPLNPNPVRIVSLSFGSSAPCNAAYQSAITELAANGVVVVVAAGNEHTGPIRPANCSGAVGVAALNRDGFKATYSNFGAGLTVATVGGDPADEGAWGPSLGDDGIVTLDNGGARGPDSGTYARAFGTSFSAPVVAGALSLMLSANPKLSHSQLVDGLRLSARPHVTSPKIQACSDANPGRCLCTTATCGAGMLDVAEAVRYAQNLHDGVVYTPRRWPNEVVDNAELDAAVALGPDLPPNGSDGVASASADSGGGGALGLPWLAALAIAVVAAARVSRRPG